MATRKFLTSVADVYAYDESDNIVFTGKTLLDSSVEVSLGSAPVRGGRGNQLQYIYYHTGEMKFTLTDTQWNLGMLGATVGETPAGGGEMYKEENVVIAAGNTGLVTATPLAFEGTTIYGWATDQQGVTQKVTFSGSSFDVTSGSGSYCVRYYTANLTSGQSFTVKANMIPQVVKLVMETQLNSADISTNKIGVVQIIAPSVVLSGAFTISMKADGISNTPLTGTALAYTPLGGTDACESEPYYAKIIEIIDNSFWYSNLAGVAVEGGDFTSASGVLTTLKVWGIPTNGGSFKLVNGLMTFTSSAPSVASVGANTGVVTALTAGSSLLSVIITGSAVPAVEASAWITVS